MDQPYDHSGSENWDQNDWSFDPISMRAKRISSCRSTKTKNRQRSCRGPLVCQVENCNNDLSQLKAYHRRYKICKQHLKVKSITRDCIQQRFCQQCGRFHDIREFDGSKRSCRVRLKRHNERRRKKPSTVRNRTESTGSLLTSSSLTMDSKIDAGEEACLFEEEYGDPSPLPSPLFSSSSQHPCFPVLPTALYRQGIAPNLSGESVLTRPNDTPTDSPTETAVSDPLAEVYRNFTQSCNPTEFLRSIESNDELMPTIHEANPLGPTTEAPLTMPLAPHVPVGPPLMDPIVFLPCKQKTTRPSNFKIDVPENVPWTGVCRNERRSSLGSDSDSMNVGSLSEEDCLTLYDNVVKLTSLSVKVYSCTPRSLPPRLRSNLVRAVRGGVLAEGYMRHGCVNLTFDIFQPASKQPLDLEGVIKRLLSSPHTSFWKKAQMMVQLDNSSMMVASGNITKRLSLEKNSQIYPHVQDITPMCVLSHGSRRFTVTGSNIDNGDKSVSIYCRVLGKFTAVVAEENKGEMGTYCFSITDKLPTGTIKVEVTKKGIIDRTLTVLSVDKRDVVEEIECYCGKHVKKDGFLSELGLLIELRCWLTDIQMRSHISVDRLRQLLQQSVRSQTKSRLSFRSCTQAEFNCLLTSAQRLYRYCDRQRLSCTKTYIWPVFWLAVGETHIEKSLQSIVDDICALINSYKDLKISISSVDSVTGVRPEGNLLVSSL